MAERLGYAFLDTGAMYRAATWHAMQQDPALRRDDSLVEAATSMRLELREEAGRQVVRVNGEDVTLAIRTPEVTRMIYRIADHPGVRARLVKLQQEWAAQGPTVAEGRDMGTVVFPEARCKIFLDASIEERTQRRFAELRARGVTADAAALREEIALRDAKDCAREVGPLRCAADAFRLDTTGKTIEQVVDEIVALAEASA